VCATVNLLVAMNLLAVARWSQLPKTTPLISSNYLKLKQTPAETRPNEIRLLLKLHGNINYLFSCHNNFSCSKKKILMQQEKKILRLGNNCFVSINIKKKHLYS